MRALAISLIFSLLFANPAQLMLFSADADQGRMGSDYEQVILLHTAYQALPASENSNQTQTKLLLVWFKLSPAINTLTNGIFPFNGQEHTVQKTILVKCLPIKNNQLNFIYPFKDYWRS